MKDERVAVVDYAAGNLTSVKTALKRLGSRYVVSKNPRELDGCDRLIFPGVGEASSAMRELSARGLDTFLKEYAESNRPMLGICLGCQILLSYSQENDTNCMDILPGEVKRFSKKSGLKVPHMGWNEVRVRKNSPLFAGIPDGSSFYFVHSYYPKPVETEEVIAFTEYGGRFPSAFGRRNLYAVQFHPEKSGERGIQLLSNFLQLDAEADTQSDTGKERRRDGGQVC